MDDGDKCKRFRKHYIWRVRLADSRDTDGLLRELGGKTCEDSLTQSSQVNITALASARREKKARTSRSETLNYTL